VVIDLIRRTGLLPEFRISKLSLESILAAAEIDSGLVNFSNLREFEIMNNNSNLFQTGFAKAMLGGILAVAVVAVSAVGGYYFFTGNSDTTNEDSASESQETVTETESTEEANDTESNQEADQEDQQQDEGQSNAGETRAESNVTRESVVIDNRVVNDYDKEYTVSAELADGETISTQFDTDSLFGEEADKAVISGENFELTVSYVWESEKRNYSDIEMVGDGIYRFVDDFFAEPPENQVKYTTLYSEDEDFCDSVGRSVPVPCGGGVMAIGPETIYDEKEEFFVVCDYENEQGLARCDQIVRSLRVER
jgi:hypothetical protein